jgi:hypothetical protein
MILKFINIVQNREKAIISLLHENCFHFMKSKLFYQKYLIFFMKMKIFNKYDNKQNIKCSASE